MSDKKVAKGLGLFGGTFDPVHLGHLVVAEWLTDSLGLQKTVFIPNYRHPFGKREDITPGEVRLEMLRLALKRYPQFEISSIELDRKGISYTVDTVQYFKEKYPDEDLYYFIGADNLKEFLSWKEPHQILRMAYLVVFNRSSSPFIEPFQHKNLLYVDSPTIDISSTHIRHRIRKNCSFRSLVPDTVYDFIINNSLYLSQ